MLAQTTYIEHLLSTPTNYTCAHLTAHQPDVSHDQANRFLRTSALPANQLRELVQPLLRDSPEAFLLVDDSVEDKRYSRFIDVAKRPYPSNAPGMVTGIGLINRVQGSGEAGDFLPLVFCSWITVFTQPTRTYSRKTTIPRPCLTKSWRKASCWPAPIYLIPGTRAAPI